MKNFIYTSFFFVFIFFSTNLLAQSLNNKCKKIAPSTQVSIIAKYDPLEYDHTKLPKTLARLHKKEYGGNVDDGYKMNGLATYNLGTMLDFQVEKKTFGNGLTCFYPTVVNLTLSIKKPTIYIAKSLKKGSCIYNIALRHEQTHQQINVEVLEHYLPQIRDKFLEAVKKYPVAARAKNDVSIDTVQDSLQKKYLQAIDPLLEEIKSEIKKEQSKLDNTENYSYEQGLCKND